MEEVTITEHVLSTFITQILSGVVESVHQQGYQVAFLASKCGETEILSLQGGLTLNIQNALEANFKQLITDNTPENTDNTPENTDNTPENTDNTLENTDNTPENTDNTPENTDNTPENTDNTPENTDNTPENTDNMCEQIITEDYSTGLPQEGEEPDVTLGPPYTLREAKLEPVATPEFGLTEISQSQSSNPDISQSEINQPDTSHAASHIQNAKNADLSLLSKCEVPPILSKPIARLKKYKYCDYTTDSRTTLLRHMRIHTGEKPLGCPVSTYKSAFQSNLRRHIGNKHSRKPQQDARKRLSCLHRCKYCDFSTNYKSNFSKHVRLKHMRHQSEPDSVNISLLVPTASNDIRHVEHVESAELLLSADTREPHYDSYSSPAGQQSVQKHTNKEKKCECCDYTTACQKNMTCLKNGVKPLTGIKKCGYCNYTARSKLDMVRHIRTHTGEKPFACPYCAYRSTVQGNLRRHVGSKHSSKSNQL